MQIAPFFYLGRSRGESKEEQVKVADAEGCAWSDCDTQQS